MNVGRFEEKERRTILADGGLGKYNYELDLLTKYMK